MTSEEVLSDRARRFLELSERFGRTARCTADSFNELRELTIVEIYFMKPVRSLITAEEMSGFVLYAESYVDRVIDSYRSGRGEYPMFLRCVMQKLACNYLKKLKTRERICSTYIRHYLPHCSPMFSPPPEEIVLAKEEQAGEDCAPAAWRLKYLCMKRPEKRRKFFMLFCAVYPLLSAETADRICRILNFRRSQTLALCDYMQKMNEGIYGPRHLQKQNFHEKMDFHWARLVASEASGEYRTDPVAAGKAERCRQTMKNLLEAACRSRKKINYGIIAEVLNTDRNSVASDIFYACRNIEELTEDGCEDTMYTLNGLKKLTLRQRMELEIPEFRPFEAFRVSLIACPED